MADLKGKVSALLENKGHTRHNCHQSVFLTKYFLSNLTALLSNEEGQKWRKLDDSCLQTLS